MRKLPSSRLSSSNGMSALTHTVGALLPMLTDVREVEVYKVFSIFFHGRSALFFLYPLERLFCGRLVLCDVTFFLFWGQPTNNGRWYTGAIFTYVPTVWSAKFSHFRFINFFFSSTSIWTRLLWTSETWCSDKFLSQSVATDVSTCHFTLFFSVESACVDLQLQRYTFILIYCSRYCDWEKILIYNWWMISGRAI